MTTSPSHRRPSDHRPWDGEGEDPAVAFGQWLRRQREVREISLREVVDATKISIRYLEALERGEFDTLPAPVFARGFLREYARYIGLDPDEAVNSYLTAEQSLEGEEEEPEEPPGGWSPAWTWGVGIAVLALLVVALLVYLLFGGGGEQGADDGAPAVRAAPAGEVPGADRAAVPAAEVPGRGGTLPAPGPEGAAADATRAPLVVTLDFAEDCWVEAEVDGGERYISELHVQGESLRIFAERRVVLTTLGNAAAVRVEANGRPIALPTVGGSDVAHDVVIDLEELAGAGAGGGE